MRADGRRPSISIRSTSNFLFQQVDLDGRPYAEGLELDRRRIASVYEPAFRLLAHLGLPLRLGEDPPGESAVLGSVPCQVDADTWTALLKSNADSRPVALVNPFGESASLNGYMPATFDHLVTRLQALIAEGYFVIMLPNGTLGTRSLPRGGACTDGAGGPSVGGLQPRSIRRWHSGGRRRSRRPHGAEREQQDARYRRLRRLRRSHRLG